MSILFEAYQMIHMILQDGAYFAISEIDSPHFSFTLIIWKLAARIFFKNSLFLVAQKKR